MYFWGPLSVLHPPPFHVGHPRKHTHTHTYHYIYIQYIFMTPQCILFLFKFNYEFFEISFFCQRPLGDLCLWDPQALELFPTGNASLSVSLSRFFIPPLCIPLSRSDGAFQEVMARLAGLQSQRPYFVGCIYLVMSATCMHFHVRGAFRHVCVWHDTFPLPDMRNTLEGTSVLFALTRSGVTVWLGAALLSFILKCSNTVCSCLIGIISNSSADCFWCISLDTHTWLDIQCSMHESRHTCRHTERRPAHTSPVALCFL